MLLVRLPVAPGGFGRAGRVRAVSGGVGPFRAVSGGAGTRPGREGARLPHHGAEEAGGVRCAAAAGAGYCARSRLAAILLLMPKISMKPLDIDWSKVSPVS
ncbi:hypothetical protein GCM10023079_23670 [Streptomyces chitinivorans]